jgi:hypothetical protein
MGENLTIFREFKFGAHKTVCELSRINAEWTHVSRNLLAVLGNAFPENNLKDSLAFFIGFAEYERYKVWREREWQFTLRNCGEESSCYIDASGWTRNLAGFKIIHEEARNEMH